MTRSIAFQTYGDCNNMPWDEGDDEVASKVSLGGNVYKCSSDIRLSDTWRRIGLSRRRFLLEDDKRKGGTTFDLNFNCKVERYFEVAQRALEQFHKMYQIGSDHEETYIMGNRMVCFLTECLPTHPGFHQPSVSHLRRECFKELEKLHNCLEDISLAIDEEQCDKFADDYEPQVESDSEDEEYSTSAHDWTTFHGKRSYHGLPQSPTSTVNTTATASLDSTDSSSSDDEIADSSTGSAFASIYTEGSPKDMSYLVDITDGFLDQIAEEQVEYEVDSEAYDSWAQGDDNESFSTSMSSCQGIKCDPARSALKGMWSRARKARFAQNKGDHFKSSTPSPDKHIDESFTPDPQHENMRHQSPTVPEFDVFDQNDNHQCFNESAVASEIQRFLDASFEYDPAKVFDNAMERFNGGNAKAANATRPARSGTPRPFLGASNKNNFPMPASDTKGLDWPRFEPPRSYRVPNLDGHVGIPRS